MVTQGGRTHARSGRGWRGLLGGHRTRPTPAPAPPAWAAAVDLTALAAFGARDLRGDNPFSAEVLGPLAPLRQAIAEHRGTLEESALIDALAAAARTTAWTAVGVWRFVAYFAPGPWRHDRRLQESFLAGLRVVAADLGPSRYHADEVEERLIRAAEPTGGPLWVVLRRAGDTGTGPDASPGPDIAVGDRHLIATFGGNELLGARVADNGYVAILARRRGTYDRRVSDEEFASADTWVGLLIAVGRKIGQPGPTMWVSDALAPYVTRVMPDWWLER
ncbi:hypothetical protein GCM10009682_52650 [Luedemannella flava]|uniref:Uncharacterized protein n=2 Tax=Luedemannella flava TaxID=349316 RepID=A0ABN2MI66_9ACTN